MLLSYGYWQRRFGGERSAVGSVVRVDDKPLQIVGVMPKDFRLVDADFDLIIPAAFNRRSLGLAGFGYRGVARLKPGVTIPQANANLAPLVSTWMDSWSNGPGTNSHYYVRWRITPDIYPLKQEVVGNIGNLLWVVMATVGMVMLLGCANVMNLMLVRAEARQRELAVRSALGAGWRRILRELFLESALLGAVAGVLGVGLALGGLKLLKAIGPANLPRLDEISLDARAIVFLFLLCVLASVFLAFLPALKYGLPQIANALSGGGRTASSSRERQRVRNALVIVQMAIALILLVTPPYDPHVCRAADGAAGLQRCQGTTDGANFCAGVGGGGRARRGANGGGADEKAGGDSRSQLSCIRQPDADGGLRLRLG